MIVGVNLNAKGEPTHYVLVTGERDGKFLIVDLWEQFRHTRVCSACENDVYFAAA